jgi:hypothetical protein
MHTFSYSFGVTLYEGMGAAMASVRYCTGTDGYRNG